MSASKRSEKELIVEVFLSNWPIKLNRCLCLFSYNSRCVVREAMVDARLPHLTELDVRFWHACHKKSSAASSHTKVNVRLCHACHAKKGWMRDCATPATLSAAASSATKYGRACRECDTHCPTRLWSALRERSWFSRQCLTGTS